MPLRTRDDRVTGITYASGATNAFAYNAFGSRISAVDSLGTRTFARNGTGVTSPVLSDGAADYTPGVSERRGGITKHQSADIKNATDQLSTSQSIAASKQYDAFGNLTNSSGTWSGQSSYGGSFGYQSEPDSGLMLLGHRYYDSTTGRFISRDPIGDGENWYGYCSGNPLTSADPTGLGIIKRGPGGSRYREDMNEKPFPDLHVWHKDGETVVTHKGGWAQGRHKGGMLAPLPRALRKPFRPIINNFVKKCAKRLGPVALLLFFVSDAFAHGVPRAVDIAARDALFADELEGITGFVRKWVKRRVNSFLRNASNKVGRSYQNRAGVTQEDEDEYGLSLDPIENGMEYDES